MTDFLDAALYYADLGYPIFPCIPKTKKPITENGLHDASTDFDQIEAWWNKYPQANIAINTAGLVVIDVDGENNPWLENKDLSGAVIALTPRGGRHFLYRQPDDKQWGCSTSKLAPKVDVRGYGGYIIAAPSIFEGKHYRWAPHCELCDPNDLSLPPEWLCDLLDNLLKIKAPVQNANTIPDGQRNSTLASLGGNMRRVGMSQPEIEAALKQVNTDRCNPPLAEKEVQRIATSVSRYEPDQISVAVAEHHFEQDQDIIIDEEKDTADPGPLPEHLLHVPGFIDEVMQHTLRTAPYPERTLAFCGALTLQAILAGRKVKEPGGSRSNLYILGLANSGTGKEHPRKVNQRIMATAGLSHQLGDNFASGEGIEDRMFASRSVLFQTDEIDDMLQSISKSRDGRAERIMAILLKFYSASGSLYHMRVKAGQDAQVIDDPCLVLFGTAIPKHYYESLCEKMLTNGFFARMLVMESGRRSDGQEVRDEPLSENIIETARHWAQVTPGFGNLHNENPQLQEVPFASGSEALLRDIRAQEVKAYNEAQDRNDAIAMALWARAVEKTRRLALLWACSENYEQPIITPRSIEWGWSLVEHLTRRMLFQVTLHVANSDFEARCKKLLGILHSWHSTKGNTPMPAWQVARRMKLSNRELDDVRNALVQQQRISYIEKPTGGTPQRLYLLT